MSFDKLILTAIDGTPVNLITIFFAVRTMKQIGKEQKIECIKTLRSAFNYADRMVNAYAVNPTNFPINSSLRYCKELYEFITAYWSLLHAIAEANGYYL